MKRIIVKILAFVVRALYFIFCIPYYYLESAANWAIGYYRKTEYVRKGRCKKCGRCCEILAVQYPDLFNRWPWLIRLIVRWQEFRYNFTYVSLENNYLFYKCNYYKSPGTCRIYWFRPRLCREYPRIKLYGRGYTYLDCGYYFVRRDGRPSFDEALHKASDRLNAGDKIESDKLD